MNLASYQAYTDYNQYCKQAFSLSFVNYIEFARHHLEQVRAKTKLPA
ncbi:MAG: hypothetical protein K0R66_1404, partial [Gammaproteobacteria bacterium]|nr:hypothetical protein [Gammaproteobacteria bacterium]